ncbi:MAG: epoxyqueuosine reductase QueH [Candidatus Omnitrophica bacterium]|nr:epoxyqueuosine reductase QueH [Candidatus Omnitrophota bacterium]
MKVLLHICCAVCAAPCVERLRQENHRVSGYFYNPNIQPEAEHHRRLQDTQRLAREMDFPLIAGDYDTDKWLSQIKGWEQEPEGGRRCSECFNLRLERTKEMLKQKVIEAFTTTLTISPHKNAQLINEIGQRIGGDSFLARDFKKQNGFKRAQELSKQHQLYHQDYCGCLYSQDRFPS